MSLDALLKLLPNSPWVTLLLIFVILYIVVERVFNFTTSIADRRSDNQLLAQAEKAATIMEKLPDHHESRADILSYITKGPVAELSKRQKERSTRNSETEEARQRKSNKITGFAAAALFLIFMLETSIPEVVEAWQDEEALYAIKVWFTLLVIGVVLFVYVLIAMIIYAIINFTDKFGAWLKSLWKDARQKVSAWRHKDNQGEDVQEEDIHPGTPTT